MISIQDKHNCCGCSSCAERCPKQCITMYEDEEGFKYPYVNLNTCINCGICENVCPVLNQAEVRKPIACYAAKNPDEKVRMNSSSGGIFFPIASKIIKEGGVVFGARYNNQWEVEHASADTIESIKRFHGSKYVQSRIGATYQQAEQILKEGRKVLFSGTPCQIAGLKRFLRNEYDNLITVDVVCHGVPSPKVWRDYVSLLPMKGVYDIRMKDKSSGWRQYSFSLIGEDGKTILSELSSENKYLMAFSRNLTLRPSCFNCPAKAGKSGSDITLGDYWGIEKLLPKMDDNKGTSFVCANTCKGAELLKSLALQIECADYDASTPYNSCIYQSTIEPVERIDFWNCYQKRGVNAILVLQPIKQNIFNRIKIRLKRLIK